MGSYWLLNTARLQAEAFFITEFYYTETHTRLGLQGNSQAKSFTIYVHRVIFHYYKIL